MAPTSLSTATATHQHRGLLDASAFSQPQRQLFGEAASRLDVQAERVEGRTAMHQPQPPPPPQRAPPQSSNQAASQTQQGSQASQHSFSNGGSRPVSQQAPGSLRPSIFRYSSSQPTPRAAADNGNDMGIYAAAYSGVHVYEMEVGGVVVMRRKHDSWLNATQILKVAGIEKGRRTKILEKEIQVGEHDKVQGGYGKYQGTWIPFERGLEVCRLYGVEDTLHRLLMHNRAEDNTDTAQVNTPTKEQAQAAQRKRIYNAGAESRASATGYSGGTFFKSISEGAAHAVAAINKARLDSPGPRRGLALPPSRAPSFHRQQSSVDDGPVNSQQSLSSGYDTQERPYSSQSGLMVDGAEPPRKRQRRAFTPGESFGYAPSQYAETCANTFPGSPTEPNESFIYSQAGVKQQRDIGTDGTGLLRPLPYEVSPAADSTRSLLMTLFMDSQESEQVLQDKLRPLTPMQLDMPIDAQSHTALHWAATLSRIRLSRALVQAGASPMRVNASGETPLMRACVVTNSMDQSSFPELLEVLGGTIDVRDDRGRTVLHHIAVTSAVKGRNGASKYYLESLLEWVVRQGGNSQTQEVSGKEPDESKMSIGRFMSEVVNAQDKNGDTALSNAARIGSRNIISQLLEVGADPKIPNRAGLRPLDFGIGIDGAAQVNGEANGLDQSGEHGSNQKGKETAEDVASAITQLIKEASTMLKGELKTKQHSIDTLHASLRTISAHVADTRRAVEAAQEKAKAQLLARQRVLNLRRAVDESEYQLDQLRLALSPLELTSIQALESTILTAKETASALSSIQDGATSTPSKQLPRHLPPPRVLKARLAAVEAMTAETQRAAEELKAQNHDVELKYRRLVALSTRQGTEPDVDALVDGLTRAVQSEDPDLEIARVRRFLGGVREAGEGVLAGF